MLLSEIFKRVDYENKCKLRKVSSELLLQFQQLPSEYIMSNYDTKLLKMLSFIAHNQWRANQRTDEWLELRKNIIGASEFAAFLGQNPNKSLNALAYDKVMGSTFTGSFETRWGVLFEPIMERFTAELFDTVIYESGSIPGIRSHTTGKILQGASPDGLAVVPKSKLIEMVNNNIILNEGVNLESEEDFIILFEFKVPAIRKPKGEIPKHYLPQVLSGINTCHTDIGIFGDCLIRMTTIEDFDWTTQFNGARNDPYRRGMSVDKVSGMGFVIFSQENIMPEFLPEIETGQIDMDIFQKYRYDNCAPLSQTLTYFNLQNNIEFINVYNYFNNEAETFKLFNISEYNIDHKYIEEVFEKFDKKELKVNYSEILYYNSDIDTKLWLRKNINIVVKECLLQNRRPTIILPYKIFDVKYNMVNKDKDYVEKSRESLEDFMNKIKTIREFEGTIEERKIMVNNMFPIKEKQTRPRRIVPKDNIHDLDNDEMNAIFG